MTSVEGQRVADPPLRCAFKRRLLSRPNSIHRPADHLTHQNIIYILIHWITMIIMTRVSIQFFPQLYRIELVNSTKNPTQTPSPSSPWSRQVSPNKTTNSTNCHSLDMCVRSRQTSISMTGTLIYAMTKICTRPLDSLPLSGTQPQNYTEQTAVMSTICFCLQQNFSENSFLFPLLR